MKQEISLREEKFAITRLAMLEALLRRVKTTPFSEIKVRDLCRDIPVSEATFFNYFPRKTDLIYYFGQLWGIEIVCGLGNRSFKNSFEKLLFVFDQAADKASENPRMMSEIVSYQALNYEKPEIPPVSSAERLRAFPDLQGVLEVDDSSLESIFSGIISEARKNGELPYVRNNIDLYAGVTALFFGLPTVVLPGNVNLGLKRGYRALLEILWNGAGGNSEY